MLKSNKKCKKQQKIEKNLRPIFCSYSMKLSKVKRKDIFRFIHLLKGFFSVENTLLSR
jgi:hypothetical protein